MLHRFEPANHRLDTRSYLLILLQEVRTFRRQHILALFQRFVFVLELITDVYKRIDALFESLQLVLKSYINIVGHMSNIDTRSSRINANAIECPQHGLNPRYVGSLGPI